ncbi:hypothetical protein HYH02_008065 [Chlamydomonas schloesseri]|uniref:Uncharacterized protein n=1 Tax=Chlamydomonas schloesseri TaxID=2026947 RepID=A0A835WG19_9CHLO|nr:hypothetical protein HYH02_008065 [Chlamydomonas schloesseri]|eukprot:KAG2446909.1 hypothetical protein HYH02_008065 [Chlamydomonas schloesseri]
MVIPASQQNGNFTNVSFCAIKAAKPRLTDRALAAGTRLLAEHGAVGCGVFWLGIGQSGDRVWWHLDNDKHVVIDANGSLTLKLGKGGRVVPLPRGHEVGPVARELLRIMRQVVGLLPVDDNDDDQEQPIPVIAPAAPAPLPIFAPATPHRMLTVTTIPVAATNAPTSSTTTTEPAAPAAARASGAANGAAAAAESVPVAQGAGGAASTSAAAAAAATANMDDVLLLVAALAERLDLMEARVQQQADQIKQLNSTVAKLSAATAAAAAIAASA